MPLRTSAQLAAHHLGTLIAALTIGALTAYAAALTWLLTPPIEITIGIAVTLVYGLRAITAPMSGTIPPTSDPATADTKGSTSPRGERDGSVGVSKRTGSPYVGNKPKTRKP